MPKALYTVFVAAFTILSGNQIVAGEASLKEIPGRNITCFGEAGRATDPQCWQHSSADFDTLRILLLETMRRNRMNSNREVAASNALSDAVAANTAAVNALALQLKTAEESRQEMFFGDFSRTVIERLNSIPVEVVTSEQMLEIIREIVNSEIARATSEAK